MRTTIHRPGRAAMRVGPRPARRRLSLLVAGAVAVALLGRPESDAGAIEVRVFAPRRLDAGALHTCAVDDDGLVRCWGTNGNGQLGYGPWSPGIVGDDETPSTAGPVDLGVDGNGDARTARGVTAGDLHTCVLLDEVELSGGVGSNVRCWGAGGDGRLGSGGTGDIDEPTDIDTVDFGSALFHVGYNDDGLEIVEERERTATAISAGGKHTCAILDDGDPTTGGDVRCWGDGTEGQLGYGNEDLVGDDEAPGDLPGDVHLGSGRTATAIATGYDHTCVILDNGRVRCWGDGSYGQLGYGNANDIGDDETPVAAGTVDLGPGRTATAIATGGFHTCVVMDNGRLRCWGHNDNGQLGYGHTDDDIGRVLTPGDPAVGTVHLGSGRTADAVSAGTVHTCAILDDGTTRCWGRGSSGELGLGSGTSVGDDETPASVDPVDIATEDTTAITLGNFHTCAALESGRLKCWGAGFQGQHGYPLHPDLIGDDETPASLGFVVLGGRLSPQPAIVIGPPVIDPPVIGR